MDVRKIIGVIVAIALAATLVILIRSDSKKSNTPDTQIVATPVATHTEPEATEIAPHYHVAVLSNSDLALYPLVRIDLDGLEVPVYACTDSEGTVRFFVYGFEEVSGQYGFLAAYPSYPTVEVDNAQGFLDMPRLAKGLTAADSEYPELVFASVNNGEAQYYYPADAEGNMRDGAIPVSVEEVNHIFGAYYVFDAEHKALICVLDGAEETPAPTEEPTAEPTAEPTEEPTPTASGKKTPKPTGKTTPKPTAVTTPEPTAQAAESATPEPTAKPTAAPTVTPAGNGHWDLVWIVDQEEVKHQEWQCLVCSKIFQSKDSCMEDQRRHKYDPNDPYYGSTGWREYWVVDSPEVGHWEPIWIPDP